MKHISRYLTLISSVIILASCSGRTETDFPEEVRDALAELDGTISRKARIEEELAARVGDMHRQLSSAGTDSARYSALDMLYSSYYQYDIDSAIFYARTKLELARDMGLTSVIHDAVLDLADRYALSGMYPEVLDIMENLGNGIFQVETVLTDPGESDGFKFIFGRDTWDGIQFAWGLCRLWQGGSDRKNNMVGNDGNGDGTYSIRVNTVDWTYELTKISPDTF